MFQYIKRNILRRGGSPNNDFGFLADQLVKYAYDQCDYQATQQSSLKVHIQAKHEGIK